MSLLEVKDLQVSFPQKQHGVKKEINVLEHVNFTLEQGEILGLVGESGCGKTTLSRSILHLTEKKGGDIRLEGRSITQLSRSEISENIQMIFQDPLGSFNSRYTMMRSLRETARVHHMGKEAFGEEIETLFSYTGLSAEMAQKYPSELSGGQLQRFAIVRALLVKPKLLIADEAVAALDVSIQREILNLLMYIRRKMNIAILFISHDLRVVENISDRVIVMYLGTIVESGTASAIFHRPVHPYTGVLLSSRTKRRPDEVRETEYQFEDIPNIFELPEGCRFRSRCSRCTDGICTEKMPQLREVESGHYAACELLQETAVNRN